MKIFNAEEHNDLCVGIDLGTTNSVLATINEKRNGEIVSKVVEISRGVDMYNAVSGDAKLTKMKKPTLPSCIYYRQENNYEPLVGDFAKMQYSLRPHLVAKSIKSQMGNLSATGLSPDIPDKSPSQISSRILKHLLKEASKVYRCDITDAVITVPANFDSVMCKATRDAAELAGIKVKNADGTERPVLLSEPNAVIYDLINQIHNGEISSRILDLNEKKRVLVFDLGGGTLDITMHEIKRRDDNKDVLKVDEIATNRYTLLGGDDFDEEIAKAMYKRYLKKYSKHPDVVAKLRQEEKVIMPQLLVYAENLKLDLNERCGGDYGSEGDYSSEWDDDDIEFTIGGNMGGIGYSYDDTFTQQEIEDILSVFMASEFSYEDYKKIDKIDNTRNIIYPVLDVLKKASEKLGEENVVVDAVIVNGGMSKFYMVTDRLTKFFGFEPIVALDPDQAVARGAAVYHYYLHKYEEMYDDMKMIGNSEKITSQNLQNSKISNDLFTDENTNEKTLIPSRGIQWGNNILNDSLYLGVKNGGVHMIIPTGAELPYKSPVMTGFKLEPGKNMIAIPIKSQNINGTYRTIANGNISFKQNYCNGAFVAFMIHMGSNKVITMKAWTSRDEEGTEKIEEGYVEIAIDDGEKTKCKSKFMAPSGSNLQPDFEINNMLQLCRNYDKCKKQGEKSSISKRISASVSNICNAGNKEEFADIVLETLERVHLEEARMRLFIIARKIGANWNAKQKRKLSDACMRQISADINGFYIGGPKVSTNIQAIYTLSICADSDQLKKISSLHYNSRYLQACLYTHAKTKSSLQWLKDEFEKDANQAIKGRSSNIQFSSHAIGVALKKDSVNTLSDLPEGKIVKKLCAVIQAGKLNSEELACCILALGCICDQRKYESAIESSIINEALSVIRYVNYNYSHNISIKQDKPKAVAEKMINGDILSADEEEFLLTKIEK